MPCFTPLFIWQSFNVQLLMCQTQENKYYVPPPFNQVLSLEERNGHENRLEQRSVIGAMTRQGRVHEAQSKK